MSGIERLANPSLIYLDANTFIHAFEPSLELDIARSDSLLKLFALSQAKKSPFLRTSEFAFGELWVGAYKDENEHLINFYNRLAVGGKMMEVAPVDIAVIRNASILRSRYPSLKMPDAIHLSTAFGFGCTHFLTDDRRLSGSFKVERNGVGQTEAHLILEIIRPDIETLERLTAEFTADE
jgi:uncharacterized protein